MRITLENSGLFVDAINIISELVSEVRIKFKKEGLEIVAIDPTNAAMILFKLPSTAFSSYELSADELIGVDLDDFKQILRRGKQEAMTLETKESRLLVSFGGERKKFNVSLIDIEEEERKEPELKFNVSLKIDSAKLQEAVDDCGVVSDSILFNVSDVGFVLDARSSLHTAAVHLLDEKFKEAAKARYSIDYLQKMVKAAKFCEDVEVQFATDYPLRLHYSTPEKAELSFILAPRVETD